MASSATFRLTNRELTGALDRLTRLGFTHGPSCAANVSILDTFDGALRRAGLHLEVRECGGLEIVLFDERAESGHPMVVAAASVPLVASELAEGPLRDRLTEAIGDRVLRDRVQMTAMSIGAVARNREGAVNAAASIFHALEVRGRGSIDEPSVVIEIRGVDGHEKRARRTVEALARLGLSRVHGPSYSSVIDAVDADRRAVTGTASVPLHPSMSAADGFRAVLANLAMTIEANWLGVIERTDPECLHQLRVAVRRSRSVLAQGREVLPTSLLEYGHEHLGWLGTVTSTARNLDVHIINWEMYTEGVDGSTKAALDPILSLIEERCTHAYAALADDLRAADEAELMARWRVQLSGPIAKSERAAHSQRRLARVVAKRVARAQAVLLQQGRAIDAQSPPEALHALRKDAKRLRYLLECFDGVLPTRRRRAFGRRLKGLQTNLGDYHDTHVLIGELVSAAVDAHDRGAAPETLLAVGRLIERLDRHRSEARFEFEEKFAAYDSTSTRRALEQLLDRVT